MPAGGWFNLHDPFGPDRFDRAISRPGAAGFMVGMPNFPAVYAIRAALDYIIRIGVEAIDRGPAPGRGLRRRVVASARRVADSPVRLNLGPGSSRSAIRNPTRSPAGSGSRTST